MDYAGIEDWPRHKPRRRGPCGLRHGAHRAAAGGGPPTRRRRLREPVLRPALAVTAVGFDPPLQHLAPEDLAAAVRRAVEEGSPGTFHVAPAAVMPLRISLERSKVSPRRAWPPTFLSGTASTTVPSSSLPAGAATVPSPASRAPSLQDAQRLAQALGAADDEPAQSSADAVTLR